MRLIDESQQCATKLLQIGDGTFPHIDGSINLQEIAHICQSENELIEQIWPNCENIQAYSYKFIAESALLALLNKTVNYLNSIIIDKSPLQVSLFMLLFTHV